VIVKMILKVLSLADWLV